LLLAVTEVHSASEEWDILIYTSRSLQLPFCPVGLASKYSKQCAKHGPVRDMVLWDSVYNSTRSCFPKRTFGKGYRSIPIMSHYMMLLRKSVEEQIPSKYAHE